MYIDVPNLVGIICMCVGVFFSVFFFSHVLFVESCKLDDRHGFLRASISAIGVSE